LKLQYRTESALLIPLLTEVKKLLEHLKKEQINPSIIEEIKKYRQKYADTADTSQTSLRYLYSLYSAVKISFSQDQKQPEKMYWLKILPVHSAVPAIISLSILIWTPLP